MTGAPWKPSKEQLAAAAGTRIKDVIGPDLEVLFCGINPSLYSGAVGHHFARPGNRFWPALHRAGFTDRELSPFEERELLAFGIGVTNLVAHATAGEVDIPSEDIARAKARLERKVKRYAPHWVAILGVGAFRKAWKAPRAVIGRQDFSISTTQVWILPNPSGLNAHFQLPALTVAFRELRAATLRR